MSSVNSIFLPVAPLTNHMCYVYMYLRLESSFFLDWLVNGVCDRAHLQEQCCAIFFDISDGGLAKSWTRAQSAAVAVGENHELLNFLETPFFPAPLAWQVAALRLVSVVDVDVAYMCKCQIQSVRVLMSY